MPTYHVINRETGAETGFEYTAEAPIDLVDYQFDLFEHREPMGPPVLGPSVYSGKRKLTKLEYRKLLREHEEKVIDRIRATFETDPRFTTDQRDNVRTFNNKYMEATLMDLDDPAQRAGLTFFASIGALDNFFRVEEILNG